MKIKIIWFLAPVVMLGMSCTNEVAKQETVLVETAEQKNTNDPNISYRKDGSKVVYNASTGLYTIWPPR